MKYFSSILTYLVPVIAVAAVACTYKESQAMYVCKHPYALCTSAICVPQPGDPSKAICQCDIEDGPSMSTASCDKLQPSTDAHGVRTIYSTFSLEQQMKQGKQSMKCPAGTPWTWCLNKRCTVAPFDPEKAICTCDVMRTGEWTTFGGDCDTSSCETGYWSGAPFKDLEEGSSFLMKALGLAETPPKWCPAP
jgi:hypothetical protein